MRKMENRYATLSMTEDEKIVFANYTPKLEITLDVAKQMVQDRVIFSGNRPHYILIDFTNVKSVTKEARDYMNSVDGGLKGILAGAFLSNNLVATMFINLYLKVSKPRIPAKFFTDKTEAVEWLQRVRQSPVNAN